MSNDTVIGSPTVNVGCWPVSSQPRSVVMCGCSAAAGVTVGGAVLTVGVFVGVAVLVVVAVDVAVAVATGMRLVGVRVAVPVGVRVRLGTGTTEKLQKLEAEGTPKALARSFSTSIPSGGATVAWKVWG